MVTHNIEGMHRAAKLRGFSLGRFPVLVVQNTLVRDINPDPSITHVFNIDEPAADCYMRRTKLPGKPLACLAQQTGRQPSIVTKATVEYHLYVPVAMA